MEKNGSSNCENKCFNNKKWEIMGSSCDNSGITIDHGYGDIFFLLYLHLRLRKKQHMEMGNPRTQ